MEIRLGVFRRRIGEKGMGEGNSSATRSHAPIKIGELLSKRDEESTFRSLL